MPHVGGAGHALDVGEGQPERLAEVADRRPCAVGGERGHERRVLASVALVHARDEHVADVAREVEVDVRQRGDLLVEEAPQQELVLDRVDVREPGQVADDRGHARPPPPPRRQHRARGVRAADLDGHLARQLEQVAVEEEEPRQPQGADDPELGLEPARGLLGARPAGVALGDEVAAELGQAAGGGRVLGPRVAVAEVTREVEPEAIGEAARLVHGLGVVAEALGHGGRRGQRVGGVTAPGGLRLVEGGAAAHGNEGVLEERALAGMGVHVAGGYARHPERGGELHQIAVAPAVVAGERPLELDAQALGPERPAEPPAERGGLGVLPALDAAGQHALACAAGEAYEPFGAALDLGERDPWGQRAGTHPRPLVRAGDQPAEVAIAGGVLAEEREVGAVLERQLSAHDRPQTERPRRLGQLHRAVDPVVVGKGERLVPLLGRHGSELDRVRRPVEERERGVAVELDVGHSEHMFAYLRTAFEGPFAPCALRLGKVPRRLSPAG